MATINVRDETYQRLARRAADQKMTVQDLVEPILDHLAGQVEATSTDVITASERRKALDEWMTIVRNRASRYPSGFVVDDSRESIYAGRGE